MKKHFLLATFMGLAAVALCQEPAKAPPSAQHKGPQVKSQLRRPAMFAKYPAGLVPPIVPRARMVQYPRIRKELGIPDALWKKIDTIYKEPINKATDGSKKPLPFEKMRENYYKRENKVLALLTSAQKTRLSQLTLQAVDILGLRSDYGRKGVGLTPEQDKKLIARWEVIFKAARKVAQQDPEPKLPPKGDPKREAAIKAAMDRHDALYDPFFAQARVYAKSVLSAAQWTQWVALQGKPYPLSREEKR